MRRLFAAMLAAFSIAAHAAPAVPQAPRADHHQHLFSPGIAALIAAPGKAPQELDAQALVRLLDAAGIDKAALLSVAYMYGKPGRKVEDEYAKVRAENDWTAAQAARYPGRLVAFCSFNPLSDYALAELARCARTPGLSRGIKLHFGNADVQLELPEHARRLREVFAAANASRMAIVVHMRASVSKQRPYGAAQASVFLEKLLPAAPDVVVQVAHFAGTGPGYDDPPSDAAMAVLAEAAERGDPRTRNLWFDIASMANGELTAGQQALLAKRIRQVGAGRVLYGSDAALGDNLRPREAWAALRGLPLTPDEVARIAANLAPYLR